MGAPRPVYAYFVTRLAQTDVKHWVHTHDGAVVEVPPPKATRVFGAQQPSAPRFVGPGVAAGEWGETVRAPLGLVVHARSGDKGSDSNVGFFVSGAEEFEWLRRLLSVDAVKELLAGEYNGKQIVSIPLVWYQRLLTHLWCRTDSSSRTSAPCISCFTTIWIAG
jgi:hypothetical protein